MLYTEILNNNKDFLYLYNKGNLIVSKHIVIYVKKNKLPYNRLGITAGKKVGNAVKRNRAKRLIRQAYRQSEVLLPIGIDIVIVARAGLIHQNGNDVTEYLSHDGVYKIKKALSDNRKSVKIDNSKENPKKNKG